MSTRNPVVFIHGNGDNGGSWQLQIERFKLKGYSDNELFAINLDPPQNESNLHYAKQVKVFVDDVLQKTGATKVDIVAHSLGSTISRYYIKFMGGAAIVEHVVLISGAHHGLSAADLTLASPEEFKQSPEITTLGSKFLDDLNTGNEEEGVETFGPTKYMTISGPHDEFYLFNPDSPQLKGADNRVIRNHSHFGLRDCKESFECMLAFSENRAESLELGKKPLHPAPEKLTGFWEIIGGPQKGHCYTFNENGTYEGNEGQGNFKGMYAIDTSVSPFRITLHQQEGPGGSGDRLGLYRIGINNSFLRLGLGELNSNDRPEHIAYAPTYERCYESSAIPKEFVGVWKIQELGFCAAAGWTAGQMEIFSDGRFTMKGKNILSPTGEFEFSGNFSLSFEPADYHFTMEFLNTDGNVPFFQAGEVIPAIFKREGNKIWAQWGSFMFGIPRPACMDSPVMFVKQ